MGSAAPLKMGKLGATLQKLWFEGTKRIREQPAPCRLRGQCRRRHQVNSQPGFSKHESGQLELSKMIWGPRRGALSWGEGTAAHKELQITHAASLPGFCGAGARLRAAPRDPPRIWTEPHGSRRSRTKPSPRGGPARRPQRNGSGFPSSDRRRESTAGTDGKNERGGSTNGATRSLTRARLARGRDRGQLCRYAPRASTTPDARLHKADARRTARGPSVRCVDAAPREQPQHRRDGSRCPVAGARAAPSRPRKAVSRVLRSLPQDCGCREQRGAAACRA